MLGTVFFFACYLTSTLWNVSIADVFQFPKCWNKRKIWFLIIKEMWLSVEFFVVAEIEDTKIGRKVVFEYHIGSWFTWDSPISIRCSAVTIDLLLFKVLWSRTPGQTDSHEFHNNSRVIIMIIIIILIIKLPFTQQRFAPLFVRWTTWVVWWSLWTSSQIIFLNA